MRSLEEQLLFMSGWMKGVPHPMTAVIGSSPPAPLSWIKWVQKMDGWTLCDCYFVYIYTASLLHQTVVYFVTYT